jgi:hypothetical protein
MIKRIGLIAVVAIGLALLIPGANVQAIFSHHHSHLQSTGGIGLGIGAIAKFKAHKDNPTQIHIRKGGTNPQGVSNTGNQAQGASNGNQAQGASNGKLEVSNLATFSKSFPGPLLGKINDNQLWGANFGILR